MARPLSPRRLIGALSIVVSVIAVAVLILAFIPKTTIVSLDLVLDRFEFSLISPMQDEAVCLLDPHVRVHSTEWTGFANCTLTVADPSPKRITFPLYGKTCAVVASSAAAFHPILEAKAASRITLLPGSRGRLALSITPPLNTTSAWTTRIVPTKELGFTGAQLNDHETPHLIRLEPDAPEVIISGTTRPARIGLDLVSQVSSHVTVAQLSDGALSERIIPGCMSSEARSFAIDGKIIWVTCSEHNPDAGPLVISNLQISEPSFLRNRGSDDESYVVGGAIKFPGGERPTIDLQPDTLLTVTSDKPMRLRSVNYGTRGELRATISGELSSISLGPATSLRDEALPSVFTWLCTHSPAAFIFTVLSITATGTIGLFKLLGLVRNADAI